ncbi:head completion protein [Vibrio phage vB_VcorM_GR28A]|nr:head completion protein [Vibrio phage vB_VcorM_GR28A]
MAHNYKQGLYKVQNPQKYKGDVDNVVFRSSWEFVAFQFCDTNPSVVAWASEEMVIPYISPIDKRPHRYFMDLTIWTRKEDGTLQKTLVEIKPQKKLKAPSRGNKKEETWLREVTEWEVNNAKWTATRKLCEREGWNFIYWTEMHLVPGRAHDKAVRIKTQKRTVARKKAMKKSGG